MAKKKKKKRGLKIRNILIFLLVVLIIGIFIYTAIKLPIKNIYISGNNILSDDIIIKDAKLDNYPSFLLTSSYEIKNNLYNNNYIKKVEINKKIGNIVEINITEYKVLALMPNENQIILSSGKIVDNNYGIMDVPILNNTISDDVFDNFIEKFSQVDRDILRQISQLEYNPVAVDNSRFLLYMNDGNLIYITLTKIDKLNKYNDIKDRMGNQTGIIYLDSGDYIELKDNKADSNDQNNNNQSNTTTTNQTNNNSNQIWEQNNNSDN